MGHPFQIRLTLRKIESQIAILTIALTSKYLHARDVIFLKEPLIQWYKLNLNYLLNHTSMTFHSYV